MDKKRKTSGVSDNPEVESLRNELIALGRKVTLDLGREAGLNPITADKFRRRMITDLGADKFLPLRQAFASHKAKLKSRAGKALVAPEKTGERV